MMKKKIRITQRIKTMVMLAFICLMKIFSPVLAQDGTDFAIIPKGEDSAFEKVETIKKGGSVWDNYNKVATGFQQGNNRAKTLGNQISTGVMTRDTLLQYIIYLAKFIGQLGLLIAAFVIIYIGYEKAAKAFDFQEDPLSNVVKGIIVLSGAYFIVKLVYSAFLA